MPFKIVLSVFLLLMIFANIAIGQTADQIKGIWQGTLDVNGAKLRLAFKFDLLGNGNIKATLDSIDQGAKDIPIPEVTFQNGQLHVNMSNIGAIYDGTLAKDGSEITGTFKQGGLALNLVLKKDDKIATINRPQEPKPPFPYDQQEVSYVNSQDRVTLAATLTLPRGQGPFPAVLLITGSGPQDRDETVFNHKPFLVLADYLTRLGIAVLRADDRGVAKSTGNFAAATSEDFARDAQAGVDYLRTRKEINAKWIGLIGHSEGGVIAPMVAAKDSGIAFIVLLAGPGVTGADIIVKQIEVLNRAAGLSEEIVAKKVARQKEIFAILRSEKDNASAEKRLHELAEKDLESLPADQRKAALAQADEKLKAVLSDWFRFFTSFDPHSALIKLKCPVLALNGERDCQVNPEQNLPVIAAALKEGGNQDFTTVKLSGLNHLFQTCQTGSIDEYGTIEETFAPVALKSIGDWLLAHTKK